MVSTTSRGLRLQNRSREENAGTLMFLRKSLISVSNPDPSDVKVSQLCLCKWHRTTGELLVYLRNEEKAESDKHCCQKYLTADVTAQNRKQGKACREMPGCYEKSTEAVLKINMATALESLLENVNSSGQSINSLSKAVSE